MCPIDGKCRATSGSNSVHFLECEYLVELACCDPMPVLSDDGNQLLETAQVLLGTLHRHFISLQIFNLMKVHGLHNVGE